MFNEELLYDYNTKLYYHLIELFDTNKCTLCLFFFMMSTTTGEEIGLQGTPGTSLSL